MRNTLIVAITLILGLGPVSTAFAANANGNASGPQALALAAVVAQHSPQLSVPEKDLLARWFNGEVNAGAPADHEISVMADAVVCRTSDVDIVDRSCDLTFGTRKITLKGREANELDVTALAAGVAPEGSAGTTFTSFSHMKCFVDPQEIMRKTGGGANCTFDTGY